MKITIYLEAHDPMAIHAVEVANAQRAEAESNKERLDKLFAFAEAQAPGFLQVLLAAVQSGKGRSEDGKAAA